MTLLSMKNLIDVYDAASELWELSCKLTGNGLDSCSVVSELLKVTDVINRESNLYQAGATRTYEDDQ